VPKFQGVGWRRNGTDFGEMARFLIPQLGEHPRVSGNLQFQQSGVTWESAFWLLDYQAAGVVSKSLRNVIPVTRVTRLILEEFSTYLAEIRARRQRIGRLSSENQLSEWGHI
jgi:hypothetical protein